MVCEDLVVVQKAGLIVDDQLAVHEQISVRREVARVGSFVLVQNPRVNLRHFVDILPFVDTLGFAGGVAVY